MKVHFFDKDWNFLFTKEMEESRIRPHFKVLEPIGPMMPTLENTPSEFLMTRYRVFKAIKISGEELDRLFYGPQKPLFYLYIEVPG